MKTLALAAAALLAGIAPAQAGKDAERDFEIRTLSTRANTVSGGDVLVEVLLPRYASASNVVVRLNGNDVSGQFTADAAGRRLVGLVTGLRVGKNRLTASAKHHHRNQHYDSLDIVNHPIHGEIFAPHQRPWVCETEASGLGAPPASGPCLAPTRYEWFYRNTSGALLPLAGAAIPADVAQTTTIDGVTVNYVVRVESGTINESIYRIAILDDPANPVSNPWSPGGKKPGPGWNGKLFYHFIGGAGPGFRSGRNIATSAINISDTISNRDEPIRLGFAVAFAARNTFGTGADEVVSAETVMMVKERFIEQYGLPKYTVGLGSSGGAIQQHLIAHNYPGLLDALTPVRNYPDVMSVATDVIDCGLLNNYFDTAVNPADWPGSRQSKVTGYPLNPAGLNNCRGWNAFARNWPGPTDGFDAVVPLEARYDPVTNPGGARGTLQDGSVSSLGINKKTGFARQPYDNIGVQYGLQALNNGDITPAEFLDLNEKVGGIDIDGNFTTSRSEGDRKGIENAYRFGRVNDGENLTLPMIQYRNYVDFANDIHTFHRSTAMLERLQKKNGTTDNVARWTMPQAGTVNFMRMALLAHDQWQANIAADTSHAPYAVKVIRNRPASLKNQCWDAAENVYDHPFALDDPGVCNTLFPMHADPRIAAGGPRAGDILKCQLKPVKAADYAVAFNADEMARLRAIFPQGVCDWSKPGVKQKPLKDSWLAYPKPGHAVRLDRGADRNDDDDDDDD
ncbi:MAG: DUF6351 family protein [Betaproteobacteria bacterium]|nr:DUF6351 family protein [Betaproteobacteria bacterium]